MYILKDYESFINEMLYTDKHYKAPYWNDNGTIRTVTNGDELRDLLTKPGFSFAYGRLGNSISYVQRESMLKSSRNKFVMHTDNETVDVFDKSWNVVKTININSEDLNPHFKRLIMRGVGNAKTNKADTDFDLMKVTNFSFQFLNKDKVYGETMKDKADYALEFANTPSNIEEYITTNSEDWKEHIKSFASKNGIKMKFDASDNIITDDEFDTELLNQIKTSPSKEQFVSVITAKKQPWFKKVDVFQTQNAQPNHFSMAYKKEEDSDAYKVKYKDTNYYILFNVYDEVGEITGQDYAQIDADTYDELVQNFCTVKSKTEKEITNDLDKALQEIESKYIYRNYTYNHILTMSFTYRLQPNKGTYQMIFVNENLKGFTTSSVKGYFTDEVFDKLVNEILEEHKGIYRDKVDASYHTFGGIE